MPEPPQDDGHSPSEIRLALDRILASPGFDKSEQLKSFLRFVVEETIAGRGDQIKAYTIAVDALGRDASFDPHLDPIVRVEAARLRRALETYYAGGGRDDSVVIELPTGHYVPVFRRNSARRGIMARLRGWRPQPDDPDMRAAPPWTAIHAAVDRVTASAAFSKSPQLAKFLRFVVDETLAGRGEQLKAYTIAVDALGRDASFDPQGDPIVRVEAGRLRRALETYYAGEGSDDPIVIELPRGSYVAVIRASPARRHRVFAGMHDQWRRLVLSTTENFRLILLIVLIAAAVSLTMELLERAIWPQRANILRSSPPSISSPDATGGVAP